jgi:hypothetical protein
MNGPLNVKLQTTIWRKQEQLHPDVRPYCCCTLTPYVVLKGIRMRRVILLLHIYLHSVDRNRNNCTCTCTWTLVLCVQSSKPLYQNNNERGITHCLCRENRGRMKVGGRRLWACSFYVHPQLKTPLQTWKRYVAVKTAIIEGVCYSATLYLCGTVCPLNSVSTCFAISRIQMLHMKAQILLTIRQWFLVSKLLLWTLTARTSLREQTRVAIFPPSAMLT